MRYVRPSVPQLSYRCDKHDLSTLLAKKKEYLFIVEIIMHWKSFFANRISFGMETDREGSRLIGI